MKKLTKLMLMVFLAWVMVCALWTLTYAAVPHLINYQGRLTDKDGRPLEGSYGLSFRIYDAESGGSLLWQESQSVLLQKGVFSVLLGGATNLDLSFDRSYFLEIKVGEEVLGPRQRITSAGYAIRAEKAEKADSVEGSIKASGGLVIETRTSDPSSPTTGQIWLRTDL